MCDGKGLGGCQVLCLSQHGWHRLGAARLFEYLTFQIQKGVRHREKGKILLGEDNAIAAMAIGNMFKARYFRIDVVKNTKELIEKYQTTYYDFILLNTWFKIGVKITRKNTGARSDIMANLHLSLVSFQNG